MKHERKCPCCHRKATQRIGKLDFCDDCAKKVRRYNSDYVWTNVHVFSIGKIKVYSDYPIQVHKNREPDKKNEKARSKAKAAIAKIEQSLASMEEDTYETYEDYIFE